MKRRKFLQQTTCAGGALLFPPFNFKNFKSNNQKYYFLLHPEITDNPDAVFIMRTNVDNKFNQSELKSAGYDFGTSVFFKTSDPSAGVPIDHAYILKPNLTKRGQWMSGYTTTGTMGVITDVYFVEGIVERMTELGILPNNIYIREVNGIENLTEGGYGDMAVRTGIDLKIIQDPIGSISRDQVQWKSLPESTYFSRLPFLKPVNTTDSWLLNIAKFKTHTMGLSLCAKNLQGCIVANYQQHCQQNMTISGDHIHDSSQTAINENYNRHVLQGISRWRTPLTSGFADSGIGQETWATRCLDNNQITQAGLHVIEGVYGRDGHFVIGPHNGLAQDFMTNVVIFGKNPFHVDIIGHWLGGHEPGNFGLFHMALERGLSQYLNPRDIPVYEWNKYSVAVLKDLSEFPRTLLLTRYLKQPDEDLWHLCDEFCSYPVTNGSETYIKKPDEFELINNYPNPFNLNTTIKFCIERPSKVLIRVFDIKGKQLLTLTNKNYFAGTYKINFNASKLSSGSYYYQILTNDINIMKKAILIK